MHCGGSLRSLVRVAARSALWSPQARPEVPLAMRSRSRAGERLPARTSQPRSRQRSAGAHDSRPRPSRCSCAREAICPRCCDRLRGVSTSAAVINAEIRALTAQARLSARVVPLLPVAGLAVAALLDAGAVRLLLTTAPGLAIVAVGAVLDLVGLLAIRAIARGIG